MPSFDAVIEPDLVELKNAVEQANKEIGTRFDFKGSSAQVMKKVHAHFAPMGDQAFRSYWFEMWTFYESKHGPAWTWERSTTGRLFTAAQLNK